MAWRFIHSAFTVQDRQYVVNIIANRQKREDLRLVLQRWRVASRRLRSGTANKEIWASLQLRTRRLQIFFDAWTKFISFSHRKQLMSNRAQVWARRRCYQTVVRLWLSWAAAQQMQQRVEEEVEHSTTHRLHAMRDEHNELADSFRKELHEHILAYEAESSLQHVQAQSEVAKAFLRGKKDSEAVCKHYEETAILNLKSSLASQAHEVSNRVEGILQKLHADRAAHAKAMVDTRQKLFAAEQYARELERMPHKTIIQFACGTEVDQQSWVRWARRHRLSHSFSCWVVWACVVTHLL
eukprot:SAG31_NODE_729_length_12511_cov_7.059293_8_plen_296_part_00